MNDSYKITTSSSIYAIKTLYNQYLEDLGININDNLCKNPNMTYVAQNYHGGSFVSVLPSWYYGTAGDTETTATLVTNVGTLITNTAKFSSTSTYFKVRVASGTTTTFLRQTVDLQVPYRQINTSDKSQDYLVLSILYEIESGDQTLDVLLQDTANASLATSYTSSYTENLYKDETNDIRRKTWYFNLNNYTASNSLKVKLLLKNTGAGTSKNYTFYETQFYQGTMIKPTQNQHPMLSYIKYEGGNWLLSNDGGENYESITSPKRIVSVGVDASCKYDNLYSAINTEAITGESTYTIFEILSDLTITSAWNTAMNLNNKKIIIRGNGHTISFAYANQTLQAQSASITLDNITLNNASLPIVFDYCNNLQLNNVKVQGDKGVVIKNSEKVKVNDFVAYNIDYTAALTLNKVYNSRIGILDISKCNYNGLFINNENVTVSNEGTNEIRLPTVAYNNNANDKNKGIVYGEVAQSQIKVVITGQTTIKEINAGDTTGTQVSFSGLEIHIDRIWNCGIAETYKGTNNNGVLLKYCHYANINFNKIMYNTGHAIKFDTSTYNRINGNAVSLNKFQVTLLDPDSATSIITTNISGIDINCNAESSENKFNIQYLTGGIESPSKNYIMNYNDYITYNVSSLNTIQAVYSDIILSNISGTSTAYVNGKLLTGKAVNQLLSALKTQVFNYANTINTKANSNTTDVTGLKNIQKDQFVWGIYGDVPEGKILEYRFPTNGKMLEFGAKLEKGNITIDFYKKAEGETQSVLVKTMNVVAQDNWQTEKITWVRPMDATDINNWRFFEDDVVYAILKNKAGDTSNLSVQLKFDKYRIWDESNVTTEIVTTA